MKKVFSLLTVVLMSSALLAQTTNLGSPFGWKNKLPIKNVPVEIMPGYDQAAIDAEDIIDDQTKDHPWRFGYKYQTNYTLENAGIWSTLPNGDKVWQLAISCPDAMTINLLIENYNLPEGAYLYLYDIDQTNRVGAYTSRNNKADGLLGTELVHGSQIIVEYYEPASVAGQGSFTITDVVHGYRSLKTIQDDLWGKALNQSGDCNIDVNCPLGIGWEDQINSVAMIVVSGSGICTGALINNACDNGIPYFLTANHCLGGSTGSWALRFNWQSPPGTESCATTANSVDPGAPYDQTANGATILANGTVSDFALLQITNMTVTDAQNWGCFYAGWDNTDATTVTEATGIHHPSGDLKKICREDNSPFHNVAAGAQVWYINQWEQGVTEPGSSGSPLFDQNGRIIGQLYGGLAACSGTNDNGQYDYYGRFGVSWVNGVSTYLAPGSCGSSTTNDGWDPNQPALADDAGIQSIVSPTGTYCTNSFIPEVTLKNFGTNSLTSATINYDIDGGTNNTFAWTGTLASGATVNITLPIMTTTSGAHVFNAYTTLPNGTADSNPGNDDASGNYTAMTNGQPITLDLNTDCYGTEVTWQIEDISSNVILSGGPYTNVAGGELITVNFCLDPGCYDFIINDTYGDGLYGSQWGGCSVDGDYTITDDNSSTVLASIIAANSDFGSQEINNFCVVSGCNGTLSQTSTNVDCNGNSSGSTTITVTGGDAPYTYDIGSGPQGSGTFNGMAAGSYTVTVIDNLACVSTISVVINEPSPLVIDSITITDEACAGNTDAAISVAASGGTSPYLFSIDCGPTYQASSNFTGLMPGTYSVTVQDANGCNTACSTETVASGTGISSTVNVVNATCYGDADGSIQVTPTNGTGPYTYDFGGGAQSGSTFSGLSAGGYSVTIVDNNGCTGTANGTVTEPTDMGASAATTDETTGNDGAINLTVTGGTAPYTYSWTGPNSFTSSTQDPNGLAGGLYDVTITDANGCTFTLPDVEVKSSVGFGENGIEFSIFPNPSNGVFTLNLTNTEKAVKLEILDITGRLIYVNQVTGNTSQIDISDKSSGTYFLRISNGDFYKKMPIVVYQK